MGGYRRNNSHVSVCNRILVEKIIPMAIERFNAGDFGKDHHVFQQKEFYKNVISKVFTISVADKFVEELRIDRGNLRNNPNIYVIKLTIPHNNEIGDVFIACVIVDTSKNRASAFCMEKSLNGFMICEWCEGKHFNFGATSNFASFFSTIIKLAEDDFKNADSVTEVHPNKNQSDSQFDYTNIRSGSNKKNNKDLKFRWIIIASSLVILIGITVIFTNIRSAHEGTALNSSEISDDTLATECVQDNHERQEEEYLDMDNYEEWAGETFVYHPEDGSIRTTSGKILSKETAPAPSPTNTEKANNSSLEINPYEDTEITRFRNGEYPYSDVYGPGKYDSESLSKLGISNKSSTDAVVLLCDATGDVIRNVFVKRGSYVTLKKIPSCKCIIKIMYGRDWYKEKDNGTGFPRGGFTRDVSYSKSKWSDAFDFVPQYVADGIDYPTYDITLHAVANGNFETKQSNKGEFFNN